MALLTGHLLNGKVVGLEVPQYSLIIEPFKIENTVSPGYVDISSVKNWWDFGFNLKRDFIYVRTEIANLIKQKGIEATVDTVSSPPEVTSEDYNKSYYIQNGVDSWQNYNGFIATWKENDEWVIEEPAFPGYRTLNAEEKLIAANLKIGSQLDHFHDFGVPKIVEYGVEFHRKSMLARAERLLIATVEVYNILPLQAAEILASLTMSPIGDIYTRYERFGVKGTFEDYNTFFNPNPTPGIADYIMARLPWDGSMTAQGFSLGMKSQDWNPIDGTDIEDFCNHLYKILVTGDFDINN